MSQEHYVVIGNGPAANEAAFTLREKAPDARITMLGREASNYYRPHLLPDFIAGEIEEDPVSPDLDPGQPFSGAGLYVNPLSLYKDKEIKLRLGQEVVHIDFESRELITGHKEVIRYDGLIIAVGGKPRIPEPLSPFRDMMLTLKTIGDARIWKLKLEKTESVVVVGGDLTSFSFVKALLKMGKRVSFILSGESFWPLRPDREVFARVEARLADKGVEIVKGNRVLRVTRLDDTTLEVQTEKAVARAGLVGAFFGLVPDVRFLARAGLHVQRGVLVDETLRTRFDRVYAAGDCAQVYCPEIRDYWVSIGYKNAKSLGEMAASNLIGGTMKTEPARIFQVGGVQINTSWWMEF